MSSSPEVEAKPDRVTFLHVNDIYETEKLDGIGGLAHLGTLIKRRRARLQGRGHDVVVVVSGDFLSASEKALMFQGQHMTELFAEWGVDYVGVGNHEFDFGAPVLLQRASETPFPWLGANLVRSDDKTHLMPPYHHDPENPSSASSSQVHLRRLASGRVLALFGLCTPETPNISYPGDEVLFDDPERVAKACLEEVAALETQVDAVVAVTHLRQAHDRQLAHRLPGIHLFLGGHDHDPHTEMVGKSLLHKSGQNGEWLGEITLSFWPGGVKAFEWKMLLNGPGIAPDPASLAVLAKYIHPADELPATRLAKLRGPLPLVSQSGLCRTKETTMGNLVSSALASFWDAAPIAAINGGYIRGNRVYLPGDTFTTADLSREFPFPCSTIKISLTGAALQDLVEQQLALLPDSSGSFGHFHGLKRHYAPDALPMSRVRRITVLTPDGWVDLLPDARYELVVTEFMFGGGDGITAYRDATVVERRDVTVKEIVKKYLEDHPDLIVENEHRTITLSD